MIRKTDIVRLNQWLTEHGHAGMAALLETGMSAYTIQRILSGGYDSAPRNMTRRALCAATGLSEDELFPVVMPNQAS